MVLQTIVHVCTLTPSISCFQPCSCYLCLENRLVLLVNLFTEFSCTLNKVICALYLPLYQTLKSQIILITTMTLGHDFPSVVAQEENVVTKEILQCLQPSFKQTQDMSFSHVSLRSTAKITS